MPPLEALRNRRWGISRKLPEKCSRDLRPPSIGEQHPRRSAVNDRLSEIRRRFVEGLLVGMEPNDLHDYVNAEQGETPKGPAGF